MRFLIRPTFAEALADAMRGPVIIPAAGPKGPLPAHDPPLAGAGLWCEGGLGHPDAFPHGRGNAVRFLFCPN